MLTDGQLGTRFSLGMTAAQPRRILGPVHSESLGMTARYRLGLAGGLSEPPVETITTVPTPTAPRP